MKKSFVLFVAVVVAAGAGSWFYLNADGKEEEAPKRRGGGPVPVVVATVDAKPVPVTVETIGSIEALATVGIKSRVDGQMMESFVREGQVVKKGDPLFTIDPRPFRAKVAEMEANLARDRAQLANAKSDLARYAKLAEGGFSSAQKFDQSKVAAAVLEAAVQVDLAQLERAKLDLEFTSIRAPVDGRLGSVLVDPGNLVKANDSDPLVVINQIRPINVTFSVAERYLSEIKERLATGGLTIEAFVPGPSTPHLRGKVVFVNNTVDASTGTIQLKAEVGNESEQLTPGQFVRVSLILYELPTALLVPSQAIQNGQKGTFVYRVTAEKKVAVVPVTLGPAWKDSIVIETGLKAGDTIVTEGQLRLRPGAQVAIAPADGDQRGKKSGAGKREGGKEGKQGTPRAPGEARGSDGPARPDRPTKSASADGSAGRGSAKAE